MLILDRKAGQQIMIGDNIVITCLKSKRGGVMAIGIDAPPEIPVHRREVFDAINEQEKGPKK